MLVKEMEEEAGHLSETAAQKKGGDPIQLGKCQNLMMFSGEQTWGIPLLRQCTATRPGLSAHLKTLITIFLIS